MASYICWAAGELGKNWYGYDQYDKDHPLQSLVHVANSDASLKERKRAAELALSIMPIVTLTEIYALVAKYAKENEGVSIKEGEEALWGRDHALDNMVRLTSAVDMYAQKLFAEMKPLEKAKLDIEAAKIIESGRTSSPLEARIAALYEMDQLTTSFRSDMKVVHWTGEESAKVFSKGSLDPEYGRVYYINGIDSRQKDLLNSIERLSEILGGISVYGVHNPSHGFGFDVFEAMINHSGQATTPVRIIQRELLEYLAAAPADKKALVFCHSQGALLMKLAIDHWPTEHLPLLDKLEVHAFAPAAYINDKAMHYVIDSDWVPTFFSKGVEKLSKESKNVIHLPPHHDGAYPHSFFGSSYTKIMLDLHFSNSTESARKPEEMDDAAASKSSKAKALSEIAKASLDRFSKPSDASGGAPLEDPFFAYANNCIALS